MSLLLHHGGRTDRAGRADDGAAIGPAEGARARTILGVSVGTRTTGDQAVVAERVPAPRREWQLFLFLLAVGLLAGVLVLALTRTDPVLAPPDSQAYLATADSIRHGDGFTVPFDTVFDSLSPRDVVAVGGRVPLAHWSPGLPSAIAILTPLAGSEVDAARVLNAGLLVVAVVLAGFIVFGITRSRWRAVVVAAVFGVLPMTLSMYRLVLADAMLVTSMLSVVLATYTVVRRTSPARLAALSALALVAATTKHAGVAVALAAAVTVALLTAGSVRTRMLRFAVVVLPAVVFEVVWLQRGDARGFHFHPPGVDDVRAVAVWIGGWFGTGAPTSLRVLAIALALAMVALAAWSAIGRDLPPDRRALTVSLGLSAVLAAVTVVLARTFVEAPVAFNGRNLYAVQVAVVLLAGSVRIAAPSWRPVVAPVVAVWCVLGAVGVLAIWPWAAREAWRYSLAGATSTYHSVSDPLPGLGQWPVSPVAARLPRDATLVSDFPENLWLEVDRAAIQLPPVRDIVADTDDHRIADHLRELASVPAPAYLVLYQCHGDGRLFPTVDRVKRYVDLERIYRDDLGGCIYRIR